MPQFRLISREIPLPLYRMGMHEAEGFARYIPIYDIKIEKGELLELQVKPESETEKGEVVESAFHALYSEDGKFFDPSIKWDNPDSNERWGIYELVKDN